MTATDQELIILKGLEGNQPTELHGLQTVIAPHSEALVLGWWGVFAMVILVLVYRMLNAYYEN